MRQIRVSPRVVFVVLASVLTLSCSQNTIIGTVSTPPAEVGASDGVTESAESSSTSHAGDVTTTILPVPDSIAHADAIRVTVSDGCPASVAGHQENQYSTAPNWVTNPSLDALRSVFVPGQPTGGLICRYTAMGVTTELADGRRLEGGSLYSATTLDAKNASQLARTLNDVVPWDIAFGCLPTEIRARYTAIAFAVEGSEDIDVWLKDWIGCPEASNGARSSGELVNGQGATFLSLLDSISPPAPPQHA